MFSAIRRDLGLKLFSVLVAVGLWLYVMNAEDPIRDESIECKIEPINVPAGLHVGGIRPEQVRLFLRGRVSGLSRDRLKRIRVFVDLSRCEVGHNQVPPVVRNVPDRVTVEGMDRQVVHVWLEQQTARSLAVSPVITGRPAPGHEVLGAPSIKPPTVRLSGPASAVAQVAELVVRVDVGGLSERRAVVADVEPLDKRRMPVKGLNLDPSQVLVDIPVYRVVVREVGIRPQLGEPDPGYVLSSVQVSPNTVRLKGRPDALSDIREVTTRRQEIRGVRRSRIYRLPLNIPRGAWPLDDVRSVVVQVTVRPKTAVAAPPTPSQTESQSTSSRSREIPRKAGTVPPEAPATAPRGRTPLDAETPLDTRAEPEATHTPDRSPAKSDASGEKEG